MLLHTPPISDPVPAPQVIADERVAVQDQVFDWTPTWAPLVMRWRWTLIPAWLVAQAACYNGLWRIGLDSAIYRQLGHSLATGQGYKIMGEAHHHVYPGLPLLLAGLELIFGAGPAWPAIVSMLILSALTVAMVYLVTRRVLPAWAATIVTAGVAFNYRFVQQGHELMTDMPFLLGVVAVLWGLEATRTGPRGRGLLAVACGLGLAAIMRPTFWVLVVAALLWTALRVLGGITSKDPGQRRNAKVALLGLVPVVLVTGAFMHFDPRAQTGQAISGAYEEEMLVRVSQVGTLLTDLPASIWEVLNDDLPRLFFAERVVGVNVIASLALLGGVLLIALRRDNVPARRPLWSLLTIVLFLAVLLASSEPRYWLMVLPVLWVGWMFGVMKGARDLFTSPILRSTYAALGLGIILACNVGHIVKLAIEQRSTPFLSHYKDGSYAPLDSTAESLRTHTSASDVVIGPYAPILQYLSDRRVLDRRDLGFGEVSEEVPRLIAVRDSGATWMIFPHQPYRQKEAELYRLISKGLIYPSNIEPSGAFVIGVFGDEDEAVEWYLAPFEIDEMVVPGALRKRLPPDVVEEDK